MDDKKYQVFVSSTYKDLYNARKKVIEAILSIYHFPVGMEMFSADDSEQWEIIKETIDASDYYIVIIGHRYGALSDEGIGYTEREYRYAKEIGVPVLAFIRSRKVLLTDDDRESDPKIQKKLDKFISLAQESKMCDFWETPEELVTKVAIALPKVFKRTPRTGWIRGSEGISIEMAEELAKLSNENRALRERVFELEKSVTSDAPKLEVFLSDIIPIKLQLFPFRPIERPSEIDFSKIASIDLIFTSEDKVDNYNLNLPTLEEVNIYNSQANFYCQFEKSKLVIKPVIKNKGTKLASSVHVTVRFPDFVRVIKTSEEDEIDMPKDIIPPSPFTSPATDNRLHSLFVRKDAYGNFVGGLLHPSLQGVPKVLPSIFDKSRVKVKDDIVTMFEEKILHTTKAIVKPLTLIPIRKGVGVISIEVICEEYKKSELYEVQIEVV